MRLKFVKINVSSVRWKSAICDFTFSAHGDNRWMPKNDK